MALSPKQIAMSWINSKLEPSKIDPEFEELEAIQPNLSKDKADKAIEYIRQDLAKVKIRYQQYTDKYVGEQNVSTKEKSEETPEIGN